MCKRSVSIVRSNVATLSRDTNLKDIRKEKEKTDIHCVILAQVSTIIKNSYESHCVTERYVPLKINRNIEWYRVLGTIFSNPPAHQTPPNNCIVANWFFFLLRNLYACRRVSMSNAISPAPPNVCVKLNAVWTSRENSIAIMAKYYKIVALALFLCLNRCVSIGGHLVVMKKEPVKVFTRTQRTRIASDLFLSICRKLNLDFCTR